MDNTVVNDGSKRKRRKKGMGREQAFQKKQRSEGKEYKTTKNRIIPAKVPPQETVCSYFFILFFSRINSLS